MQKTEYFSDETQSICRASFVRISDCGALRIDACTIYAEQSMGCAAVTEILEMPLSCQILQGQSTQNVIFHFISATMPIMSIPSFLLDFFIILNDYDGLFTSTAAFQTQRWWEISADSTVVVNGTASHFSLCVCLFQCPSGQPVFIG